MHSLESSVQQQLEIPTNVGPAIFMTVRWLEQELGPLLLNKSHETGITGTAEFCTYDNGSVLSIKGVTEAVIQTTRSYWSVPVLCWESKDVIVIPHNFLAGNQPATITCSAPGKFSRFHRWLFWGQSCRSEDHGVRLGALVNGSRGNPAEDHLGVLLYCV